MGSVNKVILVGNLGRDAELRYTPGGAAVATLNMATTEVWNDKGGQKQEKTEWHRVVLWGKTAESLNEYLTKGKQIYVEGRLQTRQWDDKDGNKRYTTEIRGDRVVLLGGGGGGRQMGGAQPRRRPERRPDGGAGQRAHRRRHPVLDIPPNCQSVRTRDSPTTDRGRLGELVVYRACSLGLQHCPRQRGHKRLALRRAMPPDFAAAQDHIEGRLSSGCRLRRHGRSVPLEQRGPVSPACG